MNCCAAYVLTGIWWKRRIRWIRFMVMLNDPVLLNDWHVVAYAPDLQEGKPMAVRLLEEDLVLWRAGDRIHAWRDLCVHRGTRLSLGKIRDETLICPYHGWTYNEAGQCIRFPA